MNIIFIGNFQNGPGGEAADETHLARELESLGNTVHRVPRDEWREYIQENRPVSKYKVPEDPEKIDIILISKWHHFYDEKFVNEAREKYDAPVFYWVWDFMTQDLPDWHVKMAQASNLYLSGELGLSRKYHELDIPFYYFQFDSCDGDFPPMSTEEKEFDVVFTGSCTNQNGRLDILKEINKEVKIQVFAHDFEEWRKQGFQAAPAVYGLEFNQVIAKSKIILGTSAGPDCYGYWSNRVGKVLHAGGFLLQWYTPGMEVIIGDACEYFSDAEEAVEKIKFYLEHPEERGEFFAKNIYSGRIRWTSNYKVRQLQILMERYKKDLGKRIWMLP